MRARAALLALLASGVLGACASEPVVHTGALPPDPPVVAPHVIDVTAEHESQAQVVMPPRELAFGITEDQLPFRLTLEDLRQGAVASGALLATLVGALVAGSLFRVATGSRTRAASALEGGPAAAGAGAVALTMLELRSAPRAQPAAPSIPHTSVGALEQALAARPEFEMPALPVRQSGPAYAPRLARGALAASRRAAGAARALARWPSIAGRATFRLAFEAPRRAWGGIERRRSPYREDGEFWVHGAEMLRMGAQNEAERHYWNGFYDCEHRGRDIEAAECLRRLAQIAAQRGEIDEARRHIEAARAVLRRRNHVARLELLDRESEELAERARAGAGDAAVV